MEPWSGGGGPWCIGTVFPAPQLLTGAAAISVSPLMFDGIGMPQRLLSTGWPLSLFEDFTPSVSEQRQGFLSFPRAAYVPEDLLEEHLQEDTVLRKAFSASSSHILGNRLQLVESRDGDHALFFPTGNNVDRIGGALCSGGTAKKWHVSTNAPSQHSAQNTSIPLLQPIFQLSAVRKDHWDPDSGFLVAARSWYKVHFLTANQEGIGIDFALPTTATFGKCVSHVAWNQHVQGEAAVVLASGEVLLYDLQRGWSTNNLNAKASYNMPPPLDSSTSFSVRTKRISKPVSKIAMHKRRTKPLPGSNLFEWWQCEYAWHPKTLLLAGSREVSLLDFRTKNGIVADQSGDPSTSTEQLDHNFNTSVVARIPGIGHAAGYLNRADAGDVVLSFARAVHDSSYEFCISTRKHLMLFDTRRPQTPLLQWLHGMEAEPPNVLAMCPIPSSSQGDSVTASDEGKVILAASFRSGNFQAFCYGPHSKASLPPPSGLMSASTPSHLDDRIYAWGLPSKVVAPQGSPNSWATILYSNKSFFQQEIRKASLSKRMWDRLSGLVLLPEKCQNTYGVEAQDRLHCSRRFSLMQLTTDGDILVQQFQAANRLRCVGSELSPSRSLSADPTGIKGRSKRRNVAKLKCFLNYMRNGSGLPGSDDSKTSKNNRERDDVSMESGISSEDQCALVPFSSHIQLVSKAGNPAVEEDSFLLEFHEDSNREKVVALVVDALHLLDVPLSLYEIAHVVLRRYIPADPVSSAGMPADVRVHNLRKYLSVLLTAQEPQGSFAEIHGWEENVGLPLKGLTVPLPVLLDNFSSESRGGTAGNQLAKFGGGGVKLSVDTNESSSVRRSVLQEGCDHVRRALNSLTTEMKCKERVQSLSLADSVEAWNNISAGAGEFDSNRLVQYQTSDRESILPSVHEKPIRGQALNMAFSRAIDEDNNNLEGDTSRADGRETSVLDKRVLGNYFGTFADGYHGTSGQKSLKNPHLCPIQLPFRTLSETSVHENAAGLSSLLDQFKQWQETFLPYQNFCRTRLPSQ